MEHQGWTIARFNVRLGMMGVDGRDRAAFVIIADRRTLELIGGRLLTAIAWSRTNGPSSGRKWSFYR